MLLHQSIEPADGAGTEPFGMQSIALVQLPKIGSVTVEPQLGPRWPDWLYWASGAQLTLEAPY
jgi:hypothetical protein